MATACISQRCGLCGFKLQTNDRIVAITDDGQQSGELLNNLSMHDDFGAAFEQCLGACPHLGGRAKGCHTSCANYVPITLRALLLKVLAYQYEPSPPELSRRMRWLRLQVTSLLRHAKPHLPQEICSQIADYSLQDTALHQYAVMQTRTLPTDRKNDSSRVRASAEIWAHFVDFEGVQYIASLSNTRDDYHAESVFRPIATQTVDCVYVAQNYLGVMRVLFCSSTQPPALDRHQGLWWKIIPLRREMVLVTKTDGIKLRAVVPANEDTGSHPGPFLWSVPPSEPIRLVQLAEGSPPPSQLSMVACNEPAVEGYSVFWKFSLVALHAHILGEDLTFYENFEAGIWLYFPLEKGEKITEIWKRGGSRVGLALIFKTNHDRVAIFGPELESKTLPASALIDLPKQNGGSRIFFEHSPLGIRSLGFETPRPAPTPDFSLALQMPESPHPKSFSESYFYSTAILDGVHMIAPCQRHVRGKLRIIGLLLHFSGGRQSCVGQIRLDCLGSLLPVGSRQSVWLGFSKDDHRPFVSVLELSEPKPTEGTWWFEVELFGRLEWWFSLKQSQVCQMGKSSPPTRL
ncbi:hypothetical protein CCHR01_14341 [Colletotrichum chrysophilum]|uniref:Uncharacterized protein n=1 Tax=Colletotrichum chrysophilum TaxID=1836956 RepID=A0AAD9A7Q8_9PEZI|nr:hypothetical protein CCHR01_14341 [Colletotrichum chrysophilum]